MQCFSKESDRMKEKLDVLYAKGPSLDIKRIKMIYFLHQFATGEEKNGDMVCVCMYDDTIRMGGLKKLSISFLCYDFFVWGSYVALGNERVEGRGA